MTTTITGNAGTPISGVIGHMAEDLLDRLHTDRVALPQGAQDSITELLRFAALAEREIAVRQERIQALLALARVDALTGLDNRKGLERAFERLASAAGRYEEPGALVMIAVEGIAELRASDSDAADVLIRAQAHALEKNVRRSDVVARTAPDEFVLLLPRCPLGAAKRKAGLIETALSAIRPSYRGRTLDSQVHSGVAAFGADSTLERTLAAALHALTRDLMR
jgi:diguanylate cyclase (GGDEF)-like protein